MIKQYLPDDIAEDYKYLVFGDGYVDFYSSDTLLNGNDYTYYRNYYTFNPDIFQEMNITPTSNITLNCVEVETTHDYVYRCDYKDILVSSFILVLGFVVLINLFTSIIKKGGVLGGLV